ncbi:MAG: hypothetical protein JWO10_412 [Microbacteriaceae bacterium]|nr:hypothetical protein [Microbacteriaceae bacterium]
MKSPILAVTVITALALTGCAAGSPGGAATASGKLDTANPYVVVFLAGVTGAQASTATEEKKSLETAAKLINSEGGVLGRKVVIESYDSKSDPTEAVSVLQKRLATGKKPDLVRAGLSSGETLALAPLLTREKILGWTSASNPLAGDSTAYPYLKLVSGSALQSAGAAKPYVLERKVRKLAMLASQDATGDGQVAAITELYKGTNVTVSVFRYSTSDVDLSIAYQRAVDSKPDMIYNDAGSLPLATRIVAARGKVPGADSIPVLAGNGSAGTLAVVAGSASAASISDFHTIASAGQVELPKAQQSASFKYWVKEMGVVKSQVASSLVYDGMRMFAAATNDAKSTNPDKVVKAIYAKNWPAGFFVTWGNAKLKWTSKSNFPVFPAGAFQVVQIGPAVTSVGQYAPLDIWPPVKK